MCGMETFCFDRRHTGFRHYNYSYHFYPKQNNGKEFSKKKKKQLDDHSLN